MSLSSVSYDEFLEIAKNLEGDDIKNLCKTNKTYYGFCNRKNFWTDLIRINFGIRVPKPGLAIYNYLKKLEEATFELPNNENYTGYDLKVYNELKNGLLIEIINFLKKEEIKAIIKGADYKYYNSKTRPNYFFRAYSLYGVAFWYYMNEPKTIIFDVPEFYFKDDDFDYTLEEAVDSLVAWNFDPGEIFHRRYDGEILRYDVRDRIIITN